MRRINFVYNSCVCFFFVLVPVVSAASSLPPYITLEGLPKAVKSTFLKTTPGILKDLSSHDINLNSVDGKLVQALMPFQKEGVR